jgi:hypothetical protein
MELESGSALPEGGYFSLLPHLQQLQHEVSQAIGPTAAELIEHLEQQAVRAGINPIAAHCQGHTPDVYLQAYPEILKLEALLIQRINSANVSEIFQLIKETEYYKPTRRVIQAISQTYLNQLDNQHQAKKKLLIQEPVIHK